MNTVISPSLLACDFLNIETEISFYKNCPDLWFHLDIMDGHFVPNLTFGHPIIELISKKTDIPLDAHLMVNNPEFYIDTFKDLNIHNLTWHIEASGENSLSLLKKAKEFYPSVGLSIKPKTALESISIDILKNLDLLLIMSVEPGFGGQKFIEDTYEKISYFSKIRSDENLDFKIQIDGGVNNLNSEKLIKCGADNLVAGSYVFSQEQNKYIDRVNSLRNHNG